MSDKIHLLGEEILDQMPDLSREILAGSARLKIELGWHYVLDLSWILSELELPAGSTVLDAGAGHGLLQFMLADRGHRVISVDMIERDLRPSWRRMYRFDHLEGESSITHDYLRYRGAMGTYFLWRLKEKVRVVRRLKALPETLESIWRSTLSSEPPPPDPERPSLTLYRSLLDDLGKLDDDSVDAVVSVSALEHNSPDDLEAIIDELERVIRPGGVMLLTVSACRERRQRHQESHSWLLGEAELERVYRLNSPASNFTEFDAIFGSLQQPRYLHRWLDASYYTSELNGMPWGEWAPQYQPVGLRREV